VRFLLQFINSASFPIFFYFSFHHGAGRALG